ncbi:hypothetical protein RUM44_008054 [Polyplax serrata]|uniref:SEA domain-containing protein n=1 Tax=Polyplax serrata TaxID=468196 RepID=A0ABR1B7N9_POLSC
MVVSKKSKSLEHTKRPKGFGNENHKRYTMRNHGFNPSSSESIGNENFDMVLVPNGKTWTLGLCSICLLHNTILVKSQKNEGNEDRFFRSDKFVQKKYNFEDFFWTGSGDGSLLDDFYHNDTGTTTTVILQSSQSDTWRTTTISPGQTASIDLSLISSIVPSPTLKTTSIGTPSVSNVFSVKTDTGVLDEKPDITISSSTPKSVTMKTIPFPDPGFVQENNGINGEVDSTTTVFPEIFHDQKYWLLTIVRNDNYLPKLEVNSTETKLSNLYQQAFNRRQENYFGSNDRKDRKMSQIVRAHIVNVTKIGNDVGLIYSVTMAGRPVPAVTAANDLRLMTVNEVIAELGHPILTKAEPFVKVPVHLGARIKGRARDTWLLIGSVIAAIFLLMLLVGLFALILSKKQTKTPKAGVVEDGGTTNLGFVEETESKPECSTKYTQKTRSKSKNLTFKSEENTGSTVKFKEDERRGSSTSSTCSGSSDAGLVRFRQQQMKRDRRRNEVKEKPKPKPRTRERRIQSSDYKNTVDRHTCILSADSIKSKNTVEDSVTEEYSPQQTRSPTSYLSMPSVKAFPRGTKIPDPLNKILEPTSIRHLDADSDTQERNKHSQNRHVDVEVQQVCEIKNKITKGKAITRHASLEADDPGFIGPIVWNKHCQKIFQRDTGVVFNEDEYGNINVGRMRKRFNELLDDALSMFGSSNGSPEASEVGPARQPDNRIHSAVLRPTGLKVVESSTCRPNTTGSRRPQSSTAYGPKGAWETPSCSTLARPMSAGICPESTPSIDKNIIYAQSELSPSDPAIPLIAAIKKELKKFDGSPTEGQPE